MRRFHWIRLCDFRTQLRESEKRQTYTVSDNNVAQKLYFLAI